MIRVIIRRAARSDIRSAKAWYDGEQIGLGQEYVHELNALVHRIRQMPLQFPDVGGGIRRALLRRFPYALYFRVKNPDQIVVFAVLHQHGHPQEMKLRAQND